MQTAVAPFTDASAQTISTDVPHAVRTATVRDDLVGWVMTGHKRLVTPSGEVSFAAGRVFVIPRLTQWDMVNEPRPGGRYEARLIAFAPALIERFHEQFGQFAGTPPVQGCASSAADEEFTATFGLAMSALLSSRSERPQADDLRRPPPEGVKKGRGGPSLSCDGKSSPAVCEHRALGVLLLLAERGLVFSAARELAWGDRVRRLVGQRPQANWSLNEVAAAFHLSASTLQRRLADESLTFSQCMREVRLETAMVLLQDSGLQVSEVAARCGYDSHSRFSAAFRERFGFTPSHLRP